MKIIILGTAYPYRGGLATFNERLARQLQSEGHEVKIYTFTLQYPSFLFPGKTQYSSEQQPSDLTIVRAVNSCNPLNWLKTGRQIARENADMLISCYWMSFMAPCMGTIARIVKKHSKTRCVALLHNLLPHEPSLLDKWMAPYFVKSEDAFLALSKSVVDEVEKFDNKGKPKTFSPHPIYDHYGQLHSKQEAAGHLSLPADRNYMLFFGLVRAYKGLDMLLDAFALVKEKLPELQLLVAGEFYEDEQKYREQIERLGLVERVVLHNEFVADSEVQYWFSVADIIVQPYRSATQSGVSQVASHFNKPMLVTNVGGLSEIVHHGEMGYAVKPDVGEIAVALLDFYGNNREETFIHAVAEEKKKYEWSVLTKKITEL